MGRPQFFTIDQSHQLARGLVFAGLGNAPGSVRYNDSTKQLNHGTLTAMDPATDWVWSSELGRGCVEFALTQRIARDAGYLNIGTVHSVAIWVASTSSSVIFGGYSPWYAMYLDATRIYYAPDDAVTYASVLHSGLSLQWRHWAVVRNGTTVTFFSNGSQLSTPQTLSSNAAFLYYKNIGAYDNGTAGTVGKLADPILHNRALSPAEIAILANKSDPMLGGLIRPIGSESNIYDREGIR